MTPARPPIAPRDLIGRLLSERERERENTATHSSLPRPFPSIPLAVLLIILHERRLAEESYSRLK